MTRNKKLSSGVIALVAVGAAVATVAVIKKVLHSKKCEDRRHLRDAEAFLREKYGDEVLDGRHLVIVEDEFYDPEEDIDIEVFE